MSSPNILKYSKKFIIISLASALAFLAAVAAISALLAFRAVAPNTRLTRPPNNIGLVGYWTMDGSDISGAALTDRSGSGNTGAIFGATSVMGKRGQALSFDGMDDYIDLTDIALMGDFTISFWFKTGNNTQTGAIFGKDSGTSLNTPKFGMANGKFFIRLASDYDNTINLPTQGQWNYVVLSRNSGEKADLYVNGGFANRLFADAAQSTTYTVNKIAANGDGSQMFSGFLDDVRIYNRALSASEIKQLYNMGR